MNSSQYVLSFDKFKRLELVYVSGNDYTYNCALNLI